MSKKRVISGILALLLTANALGTTASAITVTPPSVSDTPAWLQYAYETTVAPKIAISEGINVKLDVLDNGTSMGTYTYSTVPDSSNVLHGNSTYWLDVLYGTSKETFGDPARLLSLINLTNEIGGKESLAKNLTKSQVETFLNGFTGSTPPAGVSVHDLYKTLRTTGYNIDKVLATKVDAYTADNSKIQVYKQAIKDASVTADSELRSYMYSATTIDAELQAIIYAEGETYSNGNAVFSAVCNKIEALTLEMTNMAKYAKLKGFDSMSATAYDTFVNSEESLAGYRTRLKKIANNAYSLSVLYNYIDTVIAPKAEADSFTGVALTPAVDNTSLANSGSTYSVTSTALTKLYNWYYTKVMSNASEGGYSDITFAVCSDITDFRTVLSDISTCTPKVNEILQNWDSLMATAQGGGEFREVTPFLPYDAVRYDESNPSWYSDMVREPISVGGLDYNCNFKDTITLDSTTASNSGLNSFIVDAGCKTAEFKKDDNVTVNVTLYLANGSEIPTGTITIKESELQNYDFAYVVGKQMLEIYGDYYADVYSSALNTLYDEKLAESAAFNYLLDTLGFNENSKFLVEITHDYSGTGVLESQPAQSDADGSFIAYIPEYSLAEYYEGIAEMPSAEKFSTTATTVNSTLRSVLNSMTSGGGEKPVITEPAEIGLQLTYNPAWALIMGQVTKNKTYQGGSWKEDSVGYTRYYKNGATSSTDANASDVRAVTLAEFDSITRNPASNLTAGANPDSANFETVIAQASGSMANKTPYYKAVQRMLFPIVQYSNDGSNSSADLNEQTVLREAAEVDGTGAIKDKFSDSVQLYVTDTTVPDLTWNFDSNGAIINKKSENKDLTFDLDYHMWVAKTSAEDGIYVADWVNPSPTLLTGLQTTGANGGTITNGTTDGTSEYQSATAYDMYNVTADELTLKASNVTGDFSDWAFEKDVTPTTYVWCDSYNCFVPSDKLADHMRVWYEIEYNWVEYTASENSYDESYNETWKAPSWQSDLTLLSKGVGSYSDTTHYFDGRRNDFDDHNIGVTSGLIDDEATTGRHLPPSTATARDGSVIGFQETAENGYFNRSAEYYATSPFYKRAVEAVRASNNLAGSVSDSDETFTWEYCAVFAELWRGDIALYTKSLAVILKNKGIIEKYSDLNGKDVALAYSGEATIGNETADVNCFIHFRAVIEDDEDEEPPDETVDEGSIPNKSITDVDDITYTYEYEYRWESILNIYTGNYEMQYIPRLVQKEVRTPRAVFSPETISGNPGLSATVKYWTLEEEDKSETELKSMQCCADEHDETLVFFKVNNNGTAEYEGDPVITYNDGHLGSQGNPLKGVVTATPIYSSGTSTPTFDGEKAKSLITAAERNAFSQSIQNSIRDTSNVANTSKVSTESNTYTPKDKEFKSKSEALKGNQLESWDIQGEDLDTLLGVSGTPDTWVTFSNASQVAGLLKKADGTYLEVPDGSVKPNTNLGIVDSWSEELTTLGSYQANVEYKDYSYYPITIKKEVTSLDESRIKNDVTTNTITSLASANEDGTNVLGHDLDKYTWVSDYNNTAGKINVVPEVLMTYKTGLLDTAGQFIDEETSRGVLGSVYVAGYNKYNLEAPMYNKVTVNANADTSIIASQTATGKNANALSKAGGSLPLLYTGSEVNAMVEFTNTDTVTFTTYAIDYDSSSENVKAAWGSSAYNPETKANEWLAKYKDATGATFEAEALTSLTFGKNNAYQFASNSAVGSSNATTNILKGGNYTTTHNAISSAQTINFGGDKMSYDNSTVTGTYDIEIRNGRLSSVTISGATQDIYVDSVTTSDDFVKSTNPKLVAFRTNYPEIAEAIANMQLVEMASTLVHNGGTESWTTWQGTSLFTDSQGKTVESEVRRKKSYLDGAAQWYAEDSTVLTIKKYEIKATLPSNVAAALKIPANYGFKTPANKSDVFGDTSKIIYGFVEFGLQFKNSPLTTDAVNAVATVPSGTFDLVGDEYLGTDTDHNVDPDALFLISDGSVTDQY